MIDELFINGRFCEYKYGGVTRYAINILAEIDELLSEEKYQFIHINLLIPKDSCQYLMFKNIKIYTIGKLTGKYWEQISLPIFTRNKYLINLCSAAPLLKVKQIIVLHDARVAYKEKTDMPEIQRLFLYYSGIIFGRRLSKIITISQYSKDELNKNFKIPLEKIKVITEGYEHIEAVRENIYTLSKYGLGDKKYILGIGGSRTKNNILTAKAIKQLDASDIKLVIVGVTHDEERLLYTGMKHVLFLGQVPDEDLIMLYKHAKCLSFPSLEEGFGIPPLEAMALGCPVIASNVTAVPEICGTAALYCSPYDLSSLVIQMKRLFSDNRIEAELIRLGYENVKRFSWRKAAENLLDEALLAKKGEHKE